MKGKRKDATLYATCDTALSKAVDKLATEGSTSRASVIRRAVMQLVNRGEPMNFLGRQATAVDRQRAREVAA